MLFESIEIKGFYQKKRGFLYLVGNIFYITF